MEELSKLIEVAEEVPGGKTVAGLILGFAAVYALKVAWWATKATGKGTWKAARWCFGSNLNDLDRLVLKEVESGIWTGTWAGTGVARAGIDKAHGVFKVLAGEADITRLLSDKGRHLLRKLYDRKEREGLAAALEEERKVVLKRVSHL